MRRIFLAAIFLALSTALSTRVEAGPLTEQQARLKAAQFALVARVIQNEGKAASVLCGRRR